MPENQATSLPRPDASRKWPTHSALKLSKNARKLGCVPVVAMTCREYILHTVSQKLPRMLGNIRTPLTSPAHRCIPAAARMRLEHGLYTVTTNCREMPENQPSCFCCVLSEAREFVVGSENNLWAVPSFVDEFNKWAEKTRFQIGDSLVLNGAEEHCKKGQKLEVMVLFDKHGFDHQSTAHVPSPHHHHHHYYAPAQPLTNGGTGLKAAEGFICGTRWWKVRIRPGLGLHTVPTNYLEMPENKATSLPGQDASRTPCPKTTWNYLKIRLCPCRGSNVSRT
ncbi:Hypothetical predicted protein [Olea europaea subsp. europaea]|uniref:Uncharacterized protein n=1 Tax=Olea europaea subsp. europaea TaxID=158383 RepID=A0A8S0T0Y1_OLEEU|nr:Hypothetical predicted protein [Olea europaea subsp. europaea]